MKHLRVVAAVLLLGGLCLTMRAGYLHAKAELAGMLIRRAWERNLERRGPQPPWPWADTYPIARLQIPRLNYDEIVLEGATPRTLAFGPARVFAGPSPGEPGNLLLAGHRTSWFRSLEEIRRDDRIRLEWIDSRYGGLRQRTYAVKAVFVVLPEEVGPLMGPTSNDALTLITCYPFGRAPRSPQRFLVRALPLGPSRSANTDSDDTKTSWSLFHEYEQMAFRYHDQ